jgi:hypothetical protein
MTGEEIRKHVQARPFVPFDLHVADGRIIPVVHHDFVLISPRGRLIDVFQLNDDHDILDVHRITSVSFRANGSAGQAQPSPSNLPTE